jgi:hypothetical protein
MRYGVSTLHGAFYFNKICLKNPCINFAAQSYQSKIFQ